MKRARQLVDLLQQGQVIPPDSTIAITAAQISIKYKTAMANSFIYATALTHNATLWPQDADFQDLPNFRYFPKIKS
jgi:predicted nucleic acid-binding protein